MSGVDHCLICGSDTEFGPFGLAPRPRAMCRRCGSLERHRLIAVYLERSGVLRRSPMRVLHVAPEEPVARRLTADPAVDYLSIDLESPRAMRRMDLTRLDLPDDSIDLAVCIHVLEHIPDDDAAMSELRRVLAPGGTLIAQVPIDWDAASTDEDPSVTDPAERERRWGQSDHVRLYGPDFVDRLRSAGFDVEQFELDSSVDAAERHRLSLRDGEILHVCRPRASVDVTVGATHGRRLVVVLTERVDADTERSVRTAATIGEPIVLDRSSSPPTRVGEAEVAAVEWEDDAQVRRFLDDRGATSLLVVSDREELLVTDAAEVRAHLDAEPFVLLESPTGPELRGLPAGELLGRIGGAPPRASTGAFVRPRHDGPIRTTVVVPTFNRPGVVDAVSGALLQSAPDVEVIVVNDAGLDPRPSLGGLVDADRLTVVDADRNRGLGAARNLGMAHASGEAVLFLDDDDRVHADHVADLDRHLRSVAAPMVTGGAVMVHRDESGVETARYRRPTPSFDRDLLLVKNFIVVHTALTWLEAAHEAGRFDESLTVLEDWEFWIRLTERTAAVTVPVWSAEYHLNDRLGANVITSSAGAQLEAVRSVYERHPTLDPSIADRRRGQLAAHENELARVGASWAVTVGILGHRDPFRTAEVVESIRAKHPKDEAQIIVHQSAHPDVDAAFRPLLGQATWCIDRDLRPEIVRERLAAQALGRDLKVIDADRVPTPA
jgi:SAM-dependent methyltransferase